MTRGLVVGAALAFLASTSGACRQRGGAPVVAAAGDAGPTAPPTPPARLPRIDVHTHVMPDGIARAGKMMREWGIDGMVNLSGMYPGPPRNALEMQLRAAAQTGGHMVVFANADFRLVRARPNDYG